MIRSRTLAAVPLLLALGSAACGLLPERSLGERVWRDRCADCHGTDARGNTVRFMGNPWADLSDNLWKTDGDPGTVADVVRQGIVGLMPANDDLSEEEVTAVVDWLYHLRGEKR